MLIGGPRLALSRAWGGGGSPWIRDQACGRAGAEIWSEPHNPQSQRAELGQGADALAVGLW